MLYFSPARSRKRENCYFISLGSKKNVWTRLIVVVVVVVVVVVTVFQFLGSILRRKERRKEGVTFI